MDPGQRKMNAPVPEPRSRPRRSRRRSPLWLASWAVLAALACFLILVAAGVISDKNTSQTISTAPAAQPTVGHQAGQWHHPAGFVGRYRVDVAASSGANTGSGTTAPGSSARRISGSLTLFLRTIKHTEPLALSGILTLTGPSGEQLVYMTNLTSAQGTLHAQINGGSYFGPAIGSFTGIRHGRDLSGILNLQGFGGLSVQIVRTGTSASP